MKNQGDKFDMWGKWFALGCLGVGIKYFLLYFQSDKEI